MVNFGLNFAGLLGMALICAALIMHVSRQMPAQTHDTIFTVAALLSGYILLFYGWKLDSTLLVAQLILAIIAIFYTAESIRLRR